MLRPCGLMASYLSVVMNTTTIFVTIGSVNKHPIRVGNCVEFNYQCNLSAISIDCLLLFVIYLVVRIYLLHLACFFLIRSLSIAEEKSLFEAFPGIKKKIRKTTSSMATRERSKRVCKKKGDT